MSWQECFALDHHFLLVNARAPRSCESVHYVHLSVSALHSVTFSSFPRSPSRKAIREKTGMDANRLAERGKAGDREAFGRLYELFAKRIYAYFYYRSLSRETAEDLTSAVFVSALEGLEGYRAGARRLLGLDLLDSAQRVDRPLQAQRPLPDRGRFRGRGMGPSRRDRPRVGRPEPRPMGEAYALPGGALGRAARDHHPEALGRAVLPRDSGELGKTEGACKMAYSRALSLLREAMPLSLFIAFLAAKPPIA